ncbi:adenylate kinase family protein [Halobacteroides halobius DSM 5150]|uniref:Adenylate kinase n=1 Tax=Halobacteroides halobius (strain ATCC 35273 / DSM 5150 / MD-1) TaxID=748449 RepID=L0K5C9_HALHC|nr:adenylate kinase [Halobacteroides halobius]AGB40221.1 adenylate kinase family protein [Halobacteroides halobius DSM 5150]
MRLVLLGPPGAGKGTQAARIEAAYNLPHIATGDIFRRAINNKTALGVKAKEYIDQGKLVPDEIVVGIVEERLNNGDCQDGFILDGFPRTIEQAEALSALDFDLDVVLNIQVSEEEVINRLSGRRVCQECGATFHLEYNPPSEARICDECGGDLYQRDDDTPATIKERLDVYNNQTAPLIKYYQERDLLTSINGEQSLDNVFADISEVLEELS